MADTLMNEIADDVSEVVARTLRRLLSERSHLTQDARRTLDHSRRRAMHIADEFGHDLDVRGRRVARSVNREIHDHPFAAVALGAALGALVLTLASRRS